ncbi:hypothetical protein GF420_03310 [candidate division GN15 bacterium]|nr:hypothetical protein [candidate division GN15 bacterium]
MTRTIRILVLAVTLLVVPPVAATVSAQEEMTVEDAIRIGLENNYSIRIARNSAEIARNNEGRGTAELLPTLDASGNHTYSSTDEETNSPFSFGDSDTRASGASVALNWTLFDGFRMFAEESRYDELARLGEYQARLTIENTVVTITRAYYDLVQQEQLLDVARRTRDISRERLNKEEVRNELGGASSTDFLNARVAFNNDQATLLNQELAVTLARQELNLQLGREPDVPVTVSKQITIPPLQLQQEQVLERAEERNAALLVAQQNKRVADDLVNSQRSTFFPRISLNAEYGYSDRTTSSANPDFEQDIETQATDASIGLIASWNLFNGGRDKIAYDNARIEAINRHLELRDTRNRLVGQVRRTLEQFAKRLELVELETQNVMAAEQNLALQQDRYRIGAATSLEFRDAQVNLSRAQNALIVARYQARITRLELDQLIGNIQID